MKDVLFTAWAASTIAALVQAAAGIAGLEAHALPGENLFQILSALLVAHILGMVAFIVTPWVAIIHICCVCAAGRT